MTHGLNDADVIVLFTEIGRLRRELNEYQSVINLLRSENIKLKTRETQRGQICLLKNE